MGPMLVGLLGAVYRVERSAQLPVERIGVRRASASLSIPDDRAVRCGLCDPQIAAVAFHPGLHDQPDRRYHGREQGDEMKSCFWLALSVGALLSLPAVAQEVTLTRLDCGTGFNDPRRFSDTFAYTEPKMPFTFSCYVIKHGADYMVWDTGYLPGSESQRDQQAPRRAARAAQGQAGAGEVRRHQPFPRRPHRPAARRSRTRRC